MPIDNATLTSLSAPVDPYASVGYSAPEDNVEPTILDYLSDVPRGMARGALGFGESLYELADSGVEMFGGDLVDEDQLDFAGILGENKTIVGDLTEGITQFSLGFIPVAGVLGKVGHLNKLKDAGLLGKAAFGMIAGAPADFLAFQGNEGRLADLLTQYPSLQNPVLDYLKTDEDDSRIYGRLKNSIEGLILGPAGDLLAHSVRYLKGSRKAFESGGEKALKDFQAKANPELEGKILAAVDPDDALKQAADRASAKNVTADTSEEALKEFADNVQALKSLDDVEGHDFNFDKLLATNDVKNVINIVSETYAEQIDKLKGGVQTWDMTTAKAAKDLAEDTGLEGLSVRLSHAAKNSEQFAADLVNGKKVLHTAGALADRLAVKLADGLATDRDKAQLESLLLYFVDFKSNLKAAQTGFARATRAGGISVDEAITSGKLHEALEAGGDKTLLDIAKQLKLTEGTPRDIMNIVDTRVDGATKRFLDVHNEIWINGLLSGPTTQTVNVVSTLLHGALRSSEKVLGGLASLDGKAAAEGMHEIAGTLFNTLESGRMFLKVLNRGESILDPRHGTLDVRPGAIGTAESTQSITELATRTASGSVSPKQNALDWIGNTVRLPGRLLTAADEFNKQLFYRNNLFAKGMEDASQKGITSLADKVTHAKEFISKSINEGGRATDVDALFYAREGTFTNDLGDWGKELQRFANSHPSLRILLPFIRTPVNILSQTMRHTPIIGQINRRWRADIKAGGSKKAMAIGQQVVGGAIATHAIAAAQTGTLTGGGPSNHKQRQILEQTGWQPYSFVLTQEDGSKKYVSYARIEPFASVLGIFADYAEIGPEAERKDQESLAAGIMTAVANNITNKTYLRGLSEALEAVTDPDRNAESWIQRQAGSYVPNFLNQTKSDKTMREARSLVDALKKRLPGYSETLDPRRNIFGEPTAFNGSALVNGIDPFFVSHSNDSPARQELADLGFQMSKPRSKLAEGFDLLDLRVSETQTGHDRYQELISEVRIGGKSLEEALNEIVKDKSYQSLPAQGTIDPDIESSRFNVVKRAIQSYRRAALSRLFEDNPEWAEEYRRAMTHQRRVQVLGAQAAQ